MRSPETSFTAGASSRICASSSLVRLEAELRDEAEGADEAQRVLAEALRRDGAQAARLEVGAAAERVDELAGLEPAGHRVDREVAAAHVVLHRQRRVGDDLEVVPAGPGGDLLARRRELDPGRRQLPDPAVARVEPDADEPVGDDEVLDAPVRGERGPQALGVEAGHEEVGVLRVQPEQLVSHGAADDVGVEPERADVVLDLLPHPAILAVSRVGAVGELQQAWEENAAAWVEWASSAGHDSYWRFHRDLFLELVPAPSGRTLDVGCGEGRLARDLAALGHEVVGVDASPSMLAAARGAAPEMELHIADAADAAVCRLRRSRSSSRSCRSRTWTTSRARCARRHACSSRAGASASPSSTR